MMKEKLNLFFAYFNGLPQWYQWLLIGIFGAIYWWMVKVGYGIAGALSGVIITVVGFNPDLTTIDQQAAVDGLHAFFCFFPMGGTILAMLVMKDYDVTEERAKAIRKALGK